MTTSRAGRTAEPRHGMSAVMNPLIRALLCASLLQLTVPAHGEQAEPAAPPPQGVTAPAPDAPSATETPADSAGKVAEADRATPAAAAAETIPAAPAGPVAQVLLPRAWGHSVGDLLTQRVLLAIDGRATGLPKLPDPGRIGVWLERRPARLDTDADGRRWLLLDYQLINAPQTLTAITVPAFELRTDDGPLQVPAWTFSAAPLTPRTAFAGNGLDALQPDRAAPSIDTAPLRHRLMLWSGLTGALLLAWGGWLVWRNVRSARAQPFAQAQRTLRGLKDDAPEAWQALHRAFDRTAGASLQPASLHRLFERAPHLAPLRGDIERFYADSAARFFGDGGGAASSPRALVRTLARIERRHES